ncbi:RNA polymerase sigma-70 factor (sigma-E family) [Streptacidiphilus sp. MAP12-16]|jgi:RNA polymerase sigma-70 factor (sigma-E family)|uniref:SigE family RNA polymerase sigma factor n=1 Tax=Streptacidiphilus sp. MAP12-16 TaxID=3156300 RepID=UPI003519BB10
MNAVIEARSAAALRAARPVHANQHGTQHGTQHTVQPSAHRQSLHGIGRQGLHSTQGAHDGSTTMTLTLRGVVRSTTVRELPGGAAGSGQQTAVPVGVQGGASGEHSHDTSRTNEEEFSAYVRERRASLYATAYHLTGDRFAAEDLLQSALFSTYRAWDRITDKAAVGGYMRRTMTNLHISAWRRRKVNEYPTEEMPETVGDTDAMGGTELRAVLWQALAKLPETQRTMLVLRYYEGRTDPEIADVLNISVGTVKSSIWRALRRLREDEILASRDGDLGEAFGELVA